MNHPVPAHGGHRITLTVPAIIQSIIIGIIALIVGVVATRLIDKVTVDPSFRNFEFLVLFALWVLLVEGTIWLIRLSVFKQHLEFKPIIFNQKALMVSAVIFLLLGIWMALNNYVYAPGRVSQDTREILKTYSLPASLALAGLVILLGKSFLARGGNLGHANGHEHAIGHAHGGGGHGHGLTAVGALVLIIIVLAVLKVGQVTFSAMIRDIESSQEPADILRRTLAIDPERFVKTNTRPDWVAENLQGLQYVRFMTNFAIHPGVPSNPIHVQTGEDMRIVATPWETASMCLYRVKGTNSVGDKIVERVSMVQDLSKTRWPQHGEYVIKVAGTNAAYAQVLVGIPLPRYIIE